MKPFVCLNKYIICSSYLFFGRYAFQYYNFDSLKHVGQVWFKI